MKTLFRVDASTTLGSGHVMRCLTLADEMGEAGGSARFLCRGEAGHLCDLIASRGYPVHRLPEDVAEIPACRAALAEAPLPDWLIVDHYGLGAEWEQAVRPQVGRILAIDDIGREHDCDLLLDQNVLDDADAYRDRVSSKCRRLLGPAHALLRPEFARQRGVRRQRIEVARVLVSFGGSDPSAETAGAIEALLGVGADRITADVVLGPGNPRRQELLARYGEHPRLNLIEQSTTMAALMAEADLAIGAGGSTTWERCCLGLPTIVVPVADNQRPTTAALARLGIVEVVDMPAATRTAALSAALTRLCAAPTRRRALAEAGMRLVDGLGARRVADAMITRGGEERC